MFEDKIGKVVMIQLGDRFKYEGILIKEADGWIHIIDARTKQPASFNIKEVAGVRVL